MDIKKTEIILRALELKSLAKAAEEYNYTPSALSHMADSLEKELDVKLIKRTFSGIEPNSGSEKLISLLKKLNSLHNEIFQEAKRIKKGNNNVTVGTYASLSRHILPEITRSFRILYPHININITVSDKPLPLLLSGEADIILGEKKKASGCKWEELSRDMFAAIFPPGFYGAYDEFSWNDRYDETFIMVNEMKVVECVKKENYKNIIKVTSDDDSTVTDMVVAGMGISVLPMLSLRGQENRVKIVPINPPLERTLGLMYKKESLSNGALKAFVEHLMNTLVNKTDDI